MADKKDFEIDIDELENVSGGSCGKGPDEHLPSDHGSHIGKYDTEAYIGKVLYFVRDNDHKKYFIGKLTRSWESNFSAGSTKRVYDVNVLWCSENNIEISCHNETYNYKTTINPGIFLTRAGGDYLTVYEYNGTQYK